MSIVGKKAPLFSAGAVINGEEIVDNFSLEQYIGNKEVVFFFYPKDFTYVCPTEILAFQEKLEEYEKRGLAVVGCSTDTEESHLAWLRDLRFFILLCANPFLYICYSESIAIHYFNFFLQDGAQHCGSV